LRSELNEHRASSAPSLLLQPSTDCTANGNRGVCRACSSNSFEIRGAAALGAPIQRWFDWPFIVLRYALKPVARPPTLSCNRTFRSLTVRTIGRRFETRIILGGALSSFISAESFPFADTLPRVGAESKSRRAVISQAAFVAAREHGRPGRNQRR